MSYIIEHDNKKVMASIVSVEKDMNTLGDNPFDIQKEDDFSFSAEFIDKDNNKVVILMEYGKNYPFDVPKVSFLKTEENQFIPNWTKITKKALSEFGFFVDGKYKSYGPFTGLTKTVEIIREMHNSNRTEPEPLSE